MSTWESFTMMSTANSGTFSWYWVCRARWRQPAFFLRCKYRHHILCLNIYFMRISNYTTTNIYIYTYVYYMLCISVYYMMMCNIYVNISSYFDWCNNIAIISVIISPVYRINPAGGSWNHLVSLSSLAAPEFSQGHRLKLLEEWNCEALNDSLNGKWTWTWTEYEVGNWIIEYEMDFHECLWFAWWILMINDVVFEKKWIWNKNLKKNDDDVGTEWNMLELNGTWWSWMEHNGNMMERNGLL